MTSDGPRIDALLDEAIVAANRGDLARAHDLAEEVLREDSRNRDASELLAAEEAGTGELRRLTILCCDLVGSTELSERLPPERYRTLVSRYQHLARTIIEDRYDGHIISVKGDGFLALFGYPTAHEDDTARAVATGLDVCEAMEQLSGQAQRVVGERLDVRIGIHRGVVYVDVDADDVYGLTANLAARVATLAAPGTVVITDEVRSLAGDRVELGATAARSVKGVSEPVRHHTVVGQRAGALRFARDTPLVGRRPELAALRTTWETTHAGTAPHAAAILLRGEPGVGKTRLAAAVAAIASEQDAVVVELAGSPFHSGVGFHPVRQLLESRCGITRDLDAAERLARLRDTLAASSLDPETTVRWLAPVLGLGPESGYQPAEAEGRKLGDEIAEAVLAYLLDLFGRRSGVLLVEDLQWLDESTIALLEQVRSRGPGTLLLVVTSRPGPSFSAGTVLELQPLSVEDRLGLIDAIATVDLDAAARVSLALRSDGIPLYLEELVRSWSPEVPGADPEVGEHAVPDRLYEPLVARLLATDAAVEVAGAAATMGREVDTELLVALVDLDRAQLDRELAALTRGAILVPADGGGSELRFRHELLREVAYELQPPAIRRRVHARIADLLVLGGDAPDVVDWNMAATHYERASRPAEAASARAHAADSARRRGALGEAREQLGRSIELASGLPESRDRCALEAALRLRRGFLAMSTEGVFSLDAARDYERCLELAMEDARGDEMFSVLISLWAYHLSRAELGQARRVLEVLRPQLAGAREWFRPANRAGFGMLSWFEGDFGTALSILGDAHAALHGATIPANDVDAVWFVPNDPTASIHVHLGLARYMGGDTRGSDAAFADSVVVTEHLEFPQGPWSRCYSRWLQSWMLAEGERLDSAREAADEVFDISTRHGFDSWTMIAVTQQSAVEAVRGARQLGPDPIVAAGALSGMAEMWESLELLVLLPYHFTLAGAAFAAGGDTERALAHYEHARELADATGMCFYAAETARQRALLAGDPAAVVNELRSALDLARAQCARPFELRITLDLHARLGPAGLDDLDRAVAGYAADATSATLEAARTRLAAGR